MLWRAVAGCSAGHAPSRNKHSVSGPRGRALAAGRLTLPPLAPQFEGRLEPALSGLGASLGQAAASQAGFVRRALGLGAGANAVVSNGRVVELPAEPPSGGDDAAGSGAEFEPHDFELLELYAQRNQYSERMAELVRSASQVRPGRGGGGGGGGSPQRCEARVPALSPRQLWLLFRWRLPPARLSARARASPPSSPAVWRPPRRGPVGRGGGGVQRPGGSQARRGGAPGSAAVGVVGQAPRAARSPACQAMQGLGPPARRPHRGPPAPLHPNLPTNQPATAPLPPCPHSPIPPQVDARSGRVSELISGRSVQKNFVRVAAAGPADSAPLLVQAVVNPLSKPAQRLAPLLAFLRGVLDVDVQLLLNPEASCGWCGVVHPGTAPLPVAP